MTDERLAVARKAFADPFVGYVLNADPASLDDLDITPQRSTCLALLVQFAQAVADAETDLDRDVRRSAILGSLPQLSEAAVATVLRSWSGGGHYR